MVFSIQELYQEITFKELEDFYFLWKKFPRTVSSSFCEDFFSFKEQNQDAYKHINEEIYQKIQDKNSLFSDCLVEYHNKKIDNEIKDKTEKFYTAQISVLISQKVDNFKGFIDLNQSIYNSLSDDTGLFDGHNIDYYQESCVFKLIFELFDRYFSINSRFDVMDLKDNNLYSLYQENNINLFDCDEQYKKYELLSIKLENFEWCSNQPFQLRDIRLGKTLYFSDIIPNKFSENKNNHLTLSQFLWDCLEEGKIKNLALRPNFIDVPSDGLSYSCENFEKGKSFNINGLNHKNVAKLFQENNYNNQLWVYMDGNENITFEEFNEEDNLLNEYFYLTGLKVTNVVHLKYFQDNSGTYIEHIDHEYIFYSIEEYKLRKNNHLQKGDAKKRIKTFKIDKSKIPLNNEKDIEFLEFILKECLTHIDLIEEFLISQ